MNTCHGSGDRKLGGGDRSEHHGCSRVNITNKLLSTHAMGLVTNRQPNQDEVTEVNAMAVQKKTAQIGMT